MNKLLGKHIEGCAVLDPSLAFKTDEWFKNNTVKCTCAEKRRRKREVLQAVRRRISTEPNYGVQIAPGCYYTPPKRSH
jgi:hypothetical protein